MIEVKHELQTSARNVEAVNEECRSLQTQLSTKLQEFSTEDLKAKWLISQENIYRQQRDELNSRIEALKSKLKSMESELTNEKKMFCIELEKFSLTYDLSGSGQTRREAEYKQQILHMAEEEGLLKTELAEYTTRKAVIDLLLALKKSLHEGLEQLNNKNAGILSDLHEEIKKTSELEKQKVSVSNYVQTDQEFCSVEQELCEARHSCPEATCSHLQEQYQQLQHARWQKHVHARQQQQQQQHQQQIVQHHQEHVYSSEVLDEMFDDSDIDDSDHTLHSQGDAVTPSGSETDRKLQPRKIFRPKQPRLSQSNTTVEPL